jgi:WD40 repeat protein
MLLQLAVRAWDVRAFSTQGGSGSGDRALRPPFLGSRNSFEQALLRCAWSPDGFRLAAGSADRLVYVWDYESGGVKYALPGHTGEQSRGDREVVCLRLLPFLRPLSFLRQAPSTRWPGTLRNPSLPLLPRISVSTLGKSRSRSSD